VKSRHYLVTVSIACMAALTSGCMTARSFQKSRPVADPPARDHASADQDPSGQAAADPADSDADDPADPPTTGDPTPLTATDKLPLEMNERVQRWIEYFSVKDHDRFQRFLEQGEKFRSVVEEVLAENGLPPELFYLGMIESGYHNHATSRARAVGVWQFMPATGRRYGLEVDHYVDERRDPIRATEAAAKYLRDLYNVFGSWHLAIAAYNAGEYRIVRAVVRGKNRDFWKLARMKVLPRETCEYIPKLMAAAIIGNDPEKFGFESPSPVPYPDVESVEVPSPARLRDVAKLSGVDVTALKEVNPHLRRGATPPNSSTYEIWVPTENVKDVKKAIPQLASLSRKNRRHYRALASASDHHVHRVRRGETLSGIAERYRISLSYLKRINGLRGSRIRAGQKLRLTASTFRSRGMIRYRIHRGDSLIGISKKFKVPVRQIVHDNSLHGRRIYAGQVLRISMD
jgi:membrane-bound lytic murein transglycosylase D